jgi:hypothetical protein
MPAEVAVEHIIVVDKVVPQDLEVQVAVVTDQ